MEILGCSSPVTTASLFSQIPNLASYGGFSGKRNSFLVLGSNGYSYLSHFSSQKTSLRLRKSVILAAKKDNKRSDKKPNPHSFTVKPDEAVFPEAVLLKQKKVQEDGRLLPDFADDEEREMFEQLNLELESALQLEQMRHYEVVYAIHEDHAKEVENVNLKVQEFIKEKKGRIWRFNDWGMRRLAYKIKKARNAHYILMNFELEAKSINDFKNLLDKDERVIRHLVIKKDEAETKDCPPPPEFHTLLAGMDDDDDDDEYDEEEDDDTYDEEDDDNDEEDDGNDEEEDDVDETYEDDGNDEEDDGVDETYEDEDDDMDDTREESVDEVEEKIDGNDKDIKGEEGIMKVEDYIEGYRESRKSNKPSKSSRVGSKKLRRKKVGR